MFSTFTGKFRVAGLAIALALSATALLATESQAIEATAEQRAACTPDAFRLCSSEIPNVSAVTACMRKNRSNLSPGCKAVFAK